jgi:hypothetical protein
MAPARSESHTKHTPDWFNFWGTPLWQYTRMTDPARASRLWLALAVATLWMVRLGSELETGPTDENPDLPDLRSLLTISLQPGHRRRTRLFRLGWLRLLAECITARPLPLPRQLVPEPWPDVPGRSE